MRIWFQKEYQYWSAHSSLDVQACTNISALLFKVHLDMIDIFGNYLQNVFAEFSVLEKINLKCDNFSCFLSGVWRPFSRLSLGWFLMYVVDNRLVVISRSFFSLRFFTDFGTLVLGSYWYLLFKTSENQQNTRGVPIFSHSSGFRPVASLFHSCKLSQPYVNLIVMMFPL